MVRAVIDASLRHPTVVVLLAAMALAAGAWAAWNAPLDIFPEFAPPIVEIQTEAPGLAAEDIEALVTTPLERALLGAPALEAVRSSSAPGLSVITTVFPYGTDVYRARQFVIERLALAFNQLPVGVRPAVAPLASALTFVLAIGLRAPDVAPTVTRDYAEWILRPRLLAVPGVADVVIYGGAVRELQVTTSPERLWAARTTLDQVVSAARGIDAAAGSGFIDRAAQRLPVWLDGRLRDASTLETAVVPGQRAVPLRLSSLADVQDGAAVPLGDAVVNGERGVLLIVTRQPDVNVVAVTAAIEKALAGLSRSVPAGVQIEPNLFRPATFVDHATGNLRRALLVGAVFVTIVLLAFVGNWRAAAVSVVAIPLSLLMAIVVLRLAGETLNVMVLGGLAIAVGEVVDDAIIDVENVWRRLRHAAVGARVHDVVLAASLEVRSAVVYATCMVALVFLPVFLLGGFEGALFRPLAAAYVLATVASLVTALTVTPALSILLLPAAAARHPEPPRAVRWLRTRYERVLGRALMRPRAVFTGSVMLFAGGLALLPLVSLEFLPEFHETNFVMHMTGAPGVGLPELARVGGVAGKSMLQVPGVRSVAQLIGRSTLSEDPWGAERSEILVQLDPDADAERVTATLHERVASIAGFAFDLKQYLNERIEELLEGTGAAIVVRLRGNDLAILESAAQLVAARLQPIEGAKDVHAAGVLTSPGVKIRPRPADLARLGVTGVSVEQTMRGALGGLVVGRIEREGRQADVVVRLGEPERLDPARLDALPVMGDGGRVVPLGAVADVVRTPVRASVAHEDGIRIAIVRLDVRGRSPEAVAADVEAAVREIALPPGVYAEVSGEHVAARAARARLMGLSGLALVGIFVLLLADFGSARLALLTMVNVPLALVGGLVAVLLGASGHLSLGAVVGFVTVFGLTMRNGIVLLAHYEHEVAAQGGPLDTAALLAASSSRLAPILMTALVTGAGLLPLLALGGRAGGEIEYPLALVVVGGLVTSTVLNLLIVPVAYAALQRGPGA